MRTATIERKTAETDIRLELNLAGSGIANIHTGIGFLDHMLVLLTRHAMFDLTLQCKGDLHVDAHHSTEDIAICLGRALRKAMGEKRGILRYGNIILPMDETLILCALDISGRGACYAELDIPAQKVGEFDTELGEEFFIAFAREAGITLHLRQLCGKNSHHILEACFKALGRSLRQALTIDPCCPDGIPSTKGVLV